MNKLIMLDFDGVIADSLEVTCAATIAVLRKHGVANLTSRDAVLRLDDSNWFEGLRDAGVPLGAADEIFDIVAEGVSTGGSAPYADMPGVIARLAERHRILIVTSNRTDIVESFLAQWHITGVSEVLGGDKGTSKVRKIRAAVRRHAVADGRWFVGDSVGDIVEGRLAGVGTIAAAWGWHPLEQLKSASPHRIAGAPSDLLNFCSSSCAGLSTQ